MRWVIKSWTDSIHPLKTGAKRHPSPLGMLAKQAGKRPVSYLCAHLPTYLHDRSYSVHGFPDTLFTGVKEQSLCFCGRRG